MIKDLSTYPYVAIDVETKGLNWWEPEQGIFGIAITVPTGESLYIDIRQEKDKLAWFKNQKPKLIVNHNVKFDLHMLWSLGINFPPEICRCTMVRAALIDENLFTYSLDSLAKKYLNKNKVNDIYQELAEMFGGRSTRNAQINNLHKAPSDLVAKYAKMDTFLALKLYEYQEKEIKNQDLHDIVKFEEDFFPVIFEMERNGVKVDIDAASSAAAELSLEIYSKQSELYNIAGWDVNYNPSDDIHKLFAPVYKDEQWYACDGTPLNSTASGKASIDSEALKRMKHPAAAVILEIRKLSRCVQTFLKGHIMGNAYNGRVYPNINQVKGEIGGTATGRLSINKPALQQIPSRDKKIASVVRPIFLPEDNHYWGCWDYEQFEFRMFAHYINNNKLNTLYANNPAFDFHQLVSDLTGLPRNAPEAGGANAKQVNLGMIYDMGPGKLASIMNLPFTTETVTFKNGENKKILKAGPEALEVVEKYYAAIPGVKEFAESVKRVAKVRGYIKTLSGRHLRFPKGRFIHKAKAFLCQGSSADCMKQKMVKLHHLFKRDFPEVKLLLSVHDEINISIPEGGEEYKTKIENLITETLEDFSSSDAKFKLRLPILTDFGKGENWAIASGKGVR